MKFEQVIKEHIGVGHKSASLNLTPDPQALRASSGV